ncbi:hypothetical protein [Gimesia maris]|uniref:hypothetical protein n=1 Tax=Gimesia maris TaxID=122 RepID=UPI0030D76211|tara:strand:- start:32668 stop:32850 length:183 start_codon:yes stop_codon:yes gene_type:complete
MAITQFVKMPDPFSVSGHKSLSPDLLVAPENHFSSVFVVTSIDHNSITVGKPTVPPDRSQ